MGLRATLLNHIPACSSAFNCGDRQGSFGSMSELFLGDPFESKDRRVSADRMLVFLIGVKFTN